MDYRMNAKKRELQEKKTQLNKELANAEESLTSLVDKTISLSLKIDDIIEKKSDLIGKSYSMLRILRERANSKRNIPNKKNHHGYLFVSTTQEEERNVQIDNNAEWIKKHFSMIEDYDLCDEELTLYSWKTKIESYLPASLPGNAVQELIWYDFGNNDILSDLGLCGYCSFRSRRIVDVIEALRKMETKHKNAIYNWKLRVNAHSKLWEIELYHNLAIKVPAEMLI